VIEAEGADVMSNITAPAITALASPETMRESMDYLLVAA
jgi:hypothetical protein